MELRTKRMLIGLLGLLFLVALVIVQWMEVVRRRAEAGLAPPPVVVPANSKACFDCHAEQTPALVDHWKGSRHAEKAVGCVDCHRAQKGDPDAYDHYGELIATMVTPRDCAPCHKTEYEEFERSHHAKGGFILASLDNFLAETVEGARLPYNPHSPTPGMAVVEVNGMASVNVGCKQCHGSKIGLVSVDGGVITVDELKPDESGKPTNADAVAKIKKDENGQPILHHATWPNTGIGRINLDGSLGSCSACHSRHDFAPRRARQPENCAKCHLGPDHPQKEIYEESKHGIAYRDLRQHMNLDSLNWVLGEAYTQAPTCATCHMSASTRNGRKVTHDPGRRISWTNRPVVSLLMDTDAEGNVIKEKDPVIRRELVADSWQAKRQRMKNVCSHCHTQNYINAFYRQYDEFVINYNEKFAKPGQTIMAALNEHKLTTPTQFDEEIEWVWYYLWHHEGRRARHGASMMGPDYAHWHGMYEVAERFYMELIPLAREHCEAAMHGGNKEGAKQVFALIDSVLSRPEHKWFEEHRKQREAAAAARQALRLGTRMFVQAEKRS